MIIIQKKTYCIVKESGDDDGGDCNRLSFQGLQGINESSYCLLHMANGAHCLASLCKRIVSITRKGGVNIYTIDHHFKRSSSHSHHSWSFFNHLRTPLHYMWGLPFIRRSNGHRCMNGSANRLGEFN